MKNWQKILIAIVGSGLAGGCSYMSGLFPDWSLIIGGVSVAITGIMAKLIGWTPTK